MSLRDVSHWLKGVEVVQPDNVIYQEFSLEFAAWHNIEPGAVWDVYATYDGSVPYSVLLLRGGVMPPDRQPEYVVDGGVPKIKASGFDSVWLAQRRRPRQTLVFVGNMSSRAGEVRQAVARYNGPVGAYRPVQMWHSLTLRHVVERLAEMAGFRCTCALKNYDLVPFVMEPGLSYWDQMSKLVAPFAPYIYFRGQDARLLITDQPATQTGTGSTMVLSPDIVSRVTGLASRTRRVQRVLMRLPA